MNADFLRVPLVGGGEWTLLSRLADGRIMCCICFAYCTRDQLEPVEGEPGKVWDVCRNCAQAEEQQVRSGAIAPSDGGPTP